jgi:hypothetical protein
MNARYLDARKAVAEKGMKLPPYPLLDRYKMERAGIANLVADELLAHPEKDGVFRKGWDIKDSITALTIPASDVPPEAFGRKGAGLFVVPLDGPDGVREENHGVVVHKKSIIVFDRMIQESDKWVPGKPHEITRIPLVVSWEEFDRLPEDERRWLYRIAGEGVRPLIRVFKGWGIKDKQSVKAFYKLDRAFAIAGVANEAGAP